MKNIILLFLIFCISALDLAGAERLCTTCGKKSRRFFFTTRYAQFCSKDCVPEDKKCFSCTGLLIGRYLRIGYGGESRYYCSRCSDAPKCQSCHFPIPGKINTSNTASLCKECESKQINHSKASSLMRKIRQELKARYGYDASHRITLKLIDREAMTKLKDSSTLGYMKFNLKKQVKVRKSSGNKKKKKTQKYQMNCEIYILKTLTEENAEEVLVHELTHDYLFHHLGTTANDNVCEGICEAMAGDWLLSKGRISAFEAKKKNPDPTYGGGFRLIYPQLKRRGFKKMLEDNRHYFRPLIR